MAKPCRVAKYLQHEQTRARTIGRTSGVDKRYIDHIILDQSGDCGTQAIVPVVKKHKHMWLQIIEELMGTLMVWCILMWVVASCTSCVSQLRDQAVTKPAQQQNFSASNSIPVNQIDHNLDGMIDATEQASMPTTTPSVLVTFGVIITAVFLVTWLCAWLGARIQRNRATPNSDKPPVTPDGSEDLQGVYRDK